MHQQDSAARPASTAQPFDPPQSGQLAASVPPTADLSSFLRPATPLEALSFPTVIRLAPCQLLKIQDWNQRSVCATYDLSTVMPERIG